jgi:hypothetical protein
MQRAPRSVTQIGMLYVRPGADPPDAQPAFVLVTPDNLYPVDLSRYRELHGDQALLTLLGAHAPLEVRGRYEPDPPFTLQVSDIRVADNDDVERSYGELGLSILELGEDFELPGIRFEQVREARMGMVERQEFREELAAIRREFQESISSMRTELLTALRQGQSEIRRDLDRVITDLNTLRASENARQMELAHLQGELKVIQARITTATAVILGFVTFMASIIGVLAALGVFT